MNHSVAIREPLAEFIVGNSEHRAIADARGITPKSVRNHVTNIYRKLGVSSRPEAVRYAARMGIRPAAEQVTHP